MTEEMKQKRDELAEAFDKASWYGRRSLDYFEAGFDSAYELMEEQVRKLENRISGPAMCNSKHVTFPLKFWDCPECTTDKIAKLKSRIEKLREIISQININNPSFDDDRIGWIEIQIDRALVKDIRSALKADEGEG